MILEFREMQFIKGWPWLIALAAISGGAQADPMTFDQTQDRAVSSAPSLQVVALQFDAARVASRAAGALPDPLLNFGIDDFPISGPLAGRLGADEMTMARIGISQELPSRQRRRAELRVAQGQIAVAQAALPVEIRNVRLGAALAWIDLYYADRKLAAVDAVLQNLAPLWESLPASMTSGAVRPAMALAPIQMRGRLQDRRDEQVAALARARAELTRWTGDLAPSTVGAAPVIDFNPDALRHGLDDQPILLAFDAVGQRADADLDLARAATHPDWTVEVSYGHRDPMFGDMISIGASVRLPLFRRERQDPIIAARAADATRVAHERETARRALVAALESDLADQAMHHAQWLRARGELLAAAQQQADIETASYGAGRATLGDVMQAFTTLADAKLDALEREAIVARDGLRITLTYRGEQR